MPACTILRFFNGGAALTMRRDKMATGKGGRRDASVQHAMQQTRQTGSLMPW